MQLGSDGESSRSNESRQSTSANQQPWTKKTTSQPKKSLLNGEYDERAAQESFQQALLAWRKGSAGKKRVEIVREQTPTTTGRRHNNRDVKINTDLNDEEKQRAEQMRKLEAHITSNHTLSYADRLLLQKFRRNQLEFCGQEVNEKSPTPEYDRSLRESVNFGKNLSMPYWPLKFSFFFPKEDGLFKNFSVQ